MFDDVIGLWAILFEHWQIGYPILRLPARSNALQRTGAYDQKWFSTTYFPQSSVRRANPTLPRRKTHLLRLQTTICCTKHIARLTSARSRIPPLEYPKHVRIQLMYALLPCNPESLHDIRPGASCEMNWLFNYHHSCGIYTMQIG